MRLLWVAVLFLASLVPSFGQGNARHADSLQRLLSINPYQDATAGRLSVVVDWPTTNTYWGAPRIATWYPTNVFATNSVNVFTCPKGGQWVFLDKDDPIQNAQWGGGTNNWYIDVAGNLVLGSTNVAGKLNSIDLALQTGLVGVAYVWANNVFTASNTFTGGLLSPGLSGTNAWMAGEGAFAAGKRAIALGVKANAHTDKRSIAIGYNADADSFEGLAIGYGSRTGTNDLSTAVGYSTYAGGGGSTAIGVGSTTYDDANSSVAIGGGASVFDGSISIGPNSVSQGTNGISIGTASSASTEGVSIGYQAGGWAGGAGEFGISIGAQSFALPGTVDAIAFGHNTSVAHTNSVALGAYATTTANHQIRLGTASEDVSIPGSLTVGVTNIIGELASKAALVHNHDGSNITSGYVSVNRLGSGTPTTNTFLRGDGSWAVITTNGSSPSVPTNTVTVKGNTVTNLLAGPNTEWTISGQEAYPYIPSGSAVTNFTIKGYGVIDGTLTATNLGADASTGATEYKLLVRDPATSAVLPMTATFARDTFLAVSPATHGHSILTNLVVTGSGNSLLVSNNTTINGTLNVGGSNYVTGTIEAIGGISTTTGGITATNGTISGLVVSAGTLQNGATVNTSWDTNGIFIPYYDANPALGRRYLLSTRGSDFVKNYNLLSATNFDTSKVVFWNTNNNFTASNTFNQPTLFLGSLRSVGGSYFSSITVTNDLLSPGSDAQSFKAGFAASATNGATAVGAGAHAEAYDTVVVGASHAVGLFGISIGAQNVATNYALAGGYQTYASGVDSISLGYQSVAAGSHGISIGYNSNARESASLSIGYRANSYQSGTAVGGSAYAATGSAAFGNAAFAGGTDSVAVLGTTSGSSSAAMGTGADAGDHSGAFGYNAKATNAYSLAIGPSTVNRKSYSTALGYASAATKDHQVALGTTGDEVWVPSILVVNTTNIIEELNKKVTTNHVHDGSQITTGYVSVNRLGTGTPTTNTFLRGDGTWAVISTNGSVAPSGNSVGVNGNSITNFIDGPNVAYTISGQQAYPYIPVGSSVTNLTIAGTTTLGGTLTAASLGTDATPYGPTYKFLVRDESGYGVLPMNKNDIGTYLGYSYWAHGHSTLTNLTVSGAGISLAVANNETVGGTLTVTGDTTLATTYTGQVIASGAGSFTGNLSTTGIISSGGNATFGGPNLSVGGTNVLDYIDSKTLPTLATNTLLGRGTVSAGTPQSITVGSGLSMSGTTLSANGGVFCIASGNTIVGGSGNLITGVRSGETLTFPANSLDGKIIHIEALGVWSTDTSNWGGNTIQIIVGDLGFTMTTEEAGSETFSDEPWKFEVFIPASNISSSWGTFDRRTNNPLGSGLGYSTWVADPVIRDGSLNTTIPNTISMPITNNDQPMGAVTCYRMIVTLL